MDYIDRTYRNRFEKGRWKHFVSQYKDTDLWIGVDPAAWKPEMEAFTAGFIRTLRSDMEKWLERHPLYGKALIPYPADDRAPGIFREMSAVANQSGIGPMSAVAGAVARRVGEALKQQFGTKEVIVENGGDIYADISEDMDIAVFAGQSPLSEKVGLHILGSYSPLGICTSSGTVGPSLSFGKADAVMIICRDTSLADTYATAFANNIQTTEDIGKCLEDIGKVKEIIGAIIIKDDKMGVCGDFELKIF